MHTAANKTSHPITMSDNHDAMSCHAWLRACDQPALTAAPSPGLPAAAAAASAASATAATAATAAAAAAAAAVVR